MIDRDRADADGNRDNRHRRWFGRPQSERQALGSTMLGKRGELFETTGVVTAGFGDFEQTAILSVGVETRASYRDARTTAVSDEPLEAAIVFSQIAIGDGRCRDR